MTEEVSAAGARVPPVPPPLYFVAGLVGGRLLERAVPLPLGDGPVRAVGALLLVAGGLALAGSGVAATVRHRTTIVPHRAVRALLTTGPYGWSRNPMYTGLAIAYPGAALASGSCWPLVLWPAVVVLVDRLVVRPEERYLAARFGARYEEYRSRVRRWL